MCFGFQGQYLSRFPSPRSIQRVDAVVFISLGVRPQVNDTIIATRPPTTRVNLFHMLLKPRPTNVPAVESQTPCHGTGEGTISAVGLVIVLDYPVVLQVPFKDERLGTYITAEIWRTV